MATVYINYTMMYHSISYLSNVLCMNKFTSQKNLLGAYYFESEDVIDKYKHMLQICTFTHTTHKFVHTFVNSYSQALPWRARF